MSATQANADPPVQDVHSSSSSAVENGVTASDSPKLEKLVKVASDSPAQEAVISEDKPQTDVQDAKPAQPSTASAARPGTPSPEQEGTKKGSKDSSKSSSTPTSLEDMVEASPKPIKKSFFDTTDYVTFWSHIEAGFIREAKPTKLFSYLEHGQSTMEKAFLGELPDEHLDYLEKTALRSVIIAVVARPTPWPLELKPGANQFLHLAAQFILQRLDSPNVNHLTQSLHRIFLNNHEHCPFYIRQSKEELPEDLQRQYLPNGIVNTGNSLSEIDTTNMTPEEMIVAWKKATNWVRINSRERVTSPLYFVNVNFFGANQGFSRIVDLIESSKNMSLFTLKLCVKVLCAMRFGLSLAFLKVFLPSFVDIVCKKLLEWFGVTLKPDLRTHYNDTIDFLILMLNEIMPEEQAIQRMDTYTLDGCLMLFNTENLEKRLRGLRDIKALVDRTAKSEEKRFAAIGKFFTGQSPQEEEEEKKKKRQPRIPPKVIMGWLEQHSFMDLFFQMLKSHIEILRQGTPILIFVAQQGKLSLKHLDNIWSMAATMHEHDKRILNTSLVALVPHLPPSHLDHLITQISGSPIQSIDEQVVDLIVSLTTLSVAADTHHKWSGLQLLWELCQDPVHPTDASAVSTSAGNQAVAGSTAESDANDIESGSAPALLASASSTPKKRSKKPAGDLSSSTSAVPASTSIDPLLAHKAFTKLCDLLTTEECAPQRPTYMERCFTNLEEHRSVSLSIEIMRRCIDAYPARRRKKAVTDLESKKKLINLIFDDFQFYKNEAARLAKIQESAPVIIVAPTAVSAATLAPPAAGKKQRRKSNATEELVANAAAATASRPATPSTLASSAGNIPAAFDVNTMNVLGRGHLDNVNQRLFFLEYVISNAALTMRMEQLDLLWDLFITQALSAAEREAAFGWLERASTSSGDVVILSEVQLQHLFTEKMLTMQATAVTTAGYHLFERYFCRINDRQGKVKYGEERNDKSIGLVSPDAVGLDKLWEIALENEDKAVSAAAISTLNQLHLNLELFMNRAKAIKIRETYVQHALSKLAQPGAQAPAGSLERCLRLLMECVEDYEELKGESAIASGPGTANAGLLSGWTFGDVFGGKRGKNAGATTVKVFLKSAGKSPQRLVLNSQTTIRSIAEKATELFNFDIYDTLKLTVEDEKDKELRELDKTLGDYKVADDSTIVVRKTMESIEGSNAEGPSVFAAFLAGLPLGIGGVGATTDQIRALVARAETALKQGATNANSTGKTVAKLGSDSSSEPMFPPIIRASVPREIRLADDKARELHPARILCSPNHFGPLYDLLGTTDENLGEVLWELLTMLPKSDQKIVEITRMKDNEGVVKHFPHQKPFQMLYNLQLLENLLTKAMNPEPVIPVTTAATTNPGLAGAAILDKVWISTLLTSGLLEHLLDKFFSIKISNIRKSTATVKLLPQLLRIINMLALEVSESSSIASHLSSLNLSRSTHSHRSPAGKYRLATQREHFKTTSSTSHEEFVSDFVSKILRLSTSLASGPSQPSTLTSAALAQVMEDDALIVQEALTILIPLVTSSPSTLERFLGDESFATWLLDLTLKSPNLAIRECAVRAISELVSYTSSANSKAAVAPAASKSRPISLVLFEILLPFLVDDSVDQYASSCDEFFLTFEILLRDVAATPYYGDSKKEKKSKSEGDSKSPTAHPVLLELLKSLISKIETRPVVEKFALAGNEDKILIGLMQLVFSIVYRDGAAVAGEKTRNALYKPSCRSLVKEIFHVCLFAIPTEELRGPDAPPKCKTKASRAIAYKLLTELCSHCDRNLNTVLKLLQEQVQSIDMGGDYTYYTGRNEKSTTGYVGLQNQGATCYMNATMQQLYMVNEFRQGILSTVDQSFATPIESVLKLPPEKKKKKKVSPYYNDESDDNSSEEAAAIEWDDSTALAKLQKESVLYQLQRMFAHLQEGERRSFDTRQFCHSYKDLEGQPINTSQQMDANEYFNRLFECLEAKLVGGPKARILEQVFGGKYANQLLGTGSECSHRRESTEPFSSISVDIKHKTTLQDSLKSFCEGEVLSGDNKFQCSHCSKPVDTLKRCLIHSLPGILAIHLKRFEFDYVQMRHYKLNSSCSFPVELDMEPYMRESHAAKENAKSKAGEQGEGDNDKPSAESSNDENAESLTDLINLAQARKAAGYYDYELVGVVVHVGSSDAGHYYSFIKERPDSLPPGRVRDSTVGTKWFEFNDSYVTEFDPNKIPVECFGGEDEVMEFTDETRTTKRAVKRPRTNNAYILFYQRKGWNGSPTGENAETSVNVKNGASSSTGTHSRNPSTGTALVSATAQENGTTNDEVEELNEKSLTASRPGGGRPKVVSEDGSGDSSPNTDEPSSAEDHSASEPTTSSKANHVDGESSTAPAVQDVNGSHPDSSTTSSAATTSPSNEDPSSASSITKATGDAPSAAPDKPKVTIDTAGSGGPIDIFKSIYEENRLFILRKHLFDSEYFNFVWSIVNANLPPIPTRSQDEIRREKEDAQRKSDANRMYRERRELERETNAFPSPFVPRMGMMQNMPAPPGPRQITIGSGANAIKIEVRAINSTPASVKQEDARRAKERKEEEKRKAKEKPLDADEQRLEQDKKMDAAEKAAKDKKAADKKAAAEKKATTKKKGDAAEDGDGSKQEGDEKKKKSKKDSSTADTAEEDVSGSSGTSSVKADLTTFALDFIKNIYVHARETPLLSLWLTTLYRLYAANLNKARALLKGLIEDPSEMAHLLMNLTSEKARNCHAQMIVAAMRALAPKERSAYLSTALQLTRAAKAAQSGLAPPKDQKEPASYCVWFIEELWKLQKTARRNHFDSFYYIFAQFASFGPLERQYFMKRSYIMDVVSFALFFEPAAQHSRCLNTPRQAATEMFHLADFVSTLLLSCDAESPNTEDQPPSSLNPDTPYELTAKEHPYVLGYLFNNLLMREDVNAHAVGRIFCHFAWENKEMSDYLLNNISKGIIESSLPSQTRGYMDVLCYMVKNLDDSLQPQRLDAIIQAFVKWIQRYKNTRRSGSERVIQSFFIMASLNTTFRNKVMQAKSSLNIELDAAGYRIM